MNEGVNAAMQYLHCTICCDAPYWPLSKATNHLSFHWGKTMFDFFTDGIKRWNRYNQTRRELNLLTDRELADLGILRADIPRIAREAIGR